MASAARKGKTVKIKPARRIVPDIPAQNVWNSLADAIHQIHMQNASNLSFEECYRYGYTLVLNKQGEMLYNGVSDLVAKDIDRLAEQEVVPAFPKGLTHDRASQNQEAERLLKALKRVWDQHTSNTSRLRDVLKYMDRVHASSANVPLVWDMGMKLFLDHMIKPPIKDHLYRALLDQIQIEREGYAISRSAVKSCVDVLLQLGDKERDESATVYKQDLEPEILKESRTFYDEEAGKLLESCDAPEYLRKVEERFTSEDARAHHYLSSQTAIPLKRILEETLLTPHLYTVISMPSSGLDSMIDKDFMLDLARLYRLFGMVTTGMSVLRKALKESVLRRGKDINEASVASNEGRELNDDLDGDVKGKTKPKGRPVRAQTTEIASKWVQDVLALQDTFDRIWRQSFASDRDIETALNEAFSSFINLNSRAPEFISLFIDENLKKGLKGKTDQEADAVLDKTIIVFRYITEKDVFERYYKAHLAKRLLYARSVSDDAERGMLAKLKVECGYQFTQKLEGMFHDIKISAETMEAYTRHLAPTTPPEIDISVTVMTSTFWPMTHSGASCVLPDVLMKACKSYENFYLSRHTGRRLSWQSSLGNADVKVEFKSRKHELNVSTFALIILLLFEGLGEGEFLTYAEIKSATSIADVELQRNLQSLACAKYKILKKHPPSRDVAPEDSFSFNHDFNDKQTRIKIGTVSAKVETSGELKETRDRVDEERKHQAEACIVRIMKDRKHMTHNDLVNEVTRQLASRFQPDPSNIKKRIEGLIERDYLVRCDDRKSYDYVA